MPTLDIALPAGMPSMVAMARWALSSGQDRVIAVLQDLQPEQLTGVPAGLRNSLATLVVHVAATEVRMAYRLMGRQVPGDIPADVASTLLIDRPQNPLPEPDAPTVQSLAEAARMARSILWGALDPLTEADLAREVRLGPDRSATFRWMLSLLVTHQAQHYGQMQMIRKLL